MGVSLIATFQPKLPGEIAFAFPQTDGKCLARAVPLLDEICAAKGVAPFTRFIPDVDDLADMSPEELEEAVEQREFDFDSGEGLKIVQMLIKELKTEEKWARGRTKRERDSAKKEIDAVIWSLELLESDLKVAKRKKVRFSLCFT
jgi:hypothetical protein